MAGVVAVAVGCGLVSIPAGVIVGGAALVAFGVAAELTESEGKGV
jgi:hypothetical protein